MTKPRAIKGRDAATPHARSLSNGAKELLWTSILLVSSESAQALPDTASTDQVQARLIASIDAVYPGAKFQLGVNQRIIPNWHTYWKNPGDSGLPTTIQWRLPGGATAGEIAWPVPSRITSGPITNYAYSNEVTLLTSVTVPNTATPGSFFPIEATVKWLVCEESCIPQTVELGLNLPIVSDGQTVGAGNPLIAKAQASLPVDSPWPITVRDNHNTTALQFGGPDLSSSKIAEISFFPDTWGRINHDAPQTWRPTENGIELTLQPGEAPVTAKQALTGVLTIMEDTAEGPIRHAFAVVADPVSTRSAETVDGEVLNLPSAIGLALLGGLILNLMPCVFPVLSLKALHLVRQAGHSKGAARVQGLAYALGVLVSFAILGGILVFMKSTGSALGWGFQFQSPVFVLLAANLMFAIGLNLSGIIKLGGSYTGIGNDLANRGGMIGSFFTGALASVVAAPCTAPFMAAAVAYALAQPPIPLLSVLLALGSGLALPFLALSFCPAMQRRLPKPGVWMDTLKQALAFPMYATAAWLTWVLAEQTGSTYLPLLLGGMLALAFAAWLLQITRTSSLAYRRIATTVAALTISTPIAGVFLVADNAGFVSGQAQAVEKAANWEPFDPGRLKSLREKGQPVFLNLTAAWCISCLVNERVALNADSVQDAFRQSGLVYLKGDWTSHDPLITEKLAEFGRSGVPLYVHYPAGKNSAPIVLPQILTPQTVLSTIGAE